MFIRLEAPLKGSHKRDTAKNKMNLQQGHRPIRRSFVAQNSDRSPREFRALVRTLSQTAFPP